MMQRELFTFTWEPLPPSVIAKLMGLEPLPDSEPDPWAWSPCQIQSPAQDQ